MGTRMARLVACICLLFTLAVSLAPERAAAAPHPTLHWGSTGRYVREAQQKLKAQGFYKGAVDGVYGPRTADAVKRFQRANGLRADGAVGPNTWERMGVPKSRPRTAARAAPRTAPAARRAQGVSRRDDQHLLAQAVHAEARGEPYEGQVAVAAVILNRMKDSRFPNTIPGVIFQHRAFESVDNGEIYNSPGDSARRAAQDALNGWDPSYGAVFFWNPAKVGARSFVWTRPINSRIGRHVFAH